MAQRAKRLRRYLDDELEGCHNEDLERRLDELSTLGTAQATAELDVLSALSNET
jgi:hypothetical protein